jgi:hypothetical protein
MTDYNDGKWHGWNGGECPVHPETQGDFVFEDGNILCKRLVGEWDWDDTNLPIIAFRVVTPYVEPETYEGECWAYHYEGTPPATAIFNFRGVSIHGRWTAEHVYGKLCRFSWEADE